MSEPIQKAPSPPKRSPLFWLLVISLGFNVLTMTSSQKKTDPVLARVGANQFKLSMLSPGVSGELERMKTSQSALVNGEAEKWVEKEIVSKEAALRKVSVEQLYQSEVQPKAAVTKEQVYERYVKSPAADAVAWPQVLDDIEKDLSLERATLARKEYLASLYKKYDVRFYPQGPSPNEEGSEPVSSTKFPLYHASLNTRELSPAGLVIAPPSQGPVDAPVVLEVFVDFMCPYCQHFSETVRQLRQQYPDQLRVQFRHFPLDFHEGSHRMSEASICAQEQGKFWEYHDRLLSGTVGKKDDAALSAIAQELALDVPKFDACVQSGKYRARVDREIRAGQTAGVSGTPGYLINGRAEFGAYPPEKIKPAIDWYLNPSGPYPAVSPRPSQKPDAPSGPAVDPNKVYTFQDDWLNTGPSLGPKNAPITIVEFFDFNCPFCKKGAQTMEELVKRHPDQIRLVPKNFPLSIHPNAMKTSEAVLCADDQGKFWEYRKEVFGDSWGKNTPEDLKAIAAKVGLNTGDFNACLDGDKTKERLQKDMSVADGLGVQSTPTFFINGKLVSGALPIENFEKMLAAPAEPAEAKAPAAAPSKTPQQYYA